ncbi:MAG: hypothetical protein AVDCRST_MAG49-4647 [uncultured Thermomicrobiales bacterium]|uniref:Uncharacterized protein n=1 Tax=uncultured Thermomicrobiales bacterium TaxID=1645740 RepID=A0A6J4VIQ6_9BACT|nr:MAG: hypothetical protein AVDCRST_MAG49-4647 [uncultured Thermomicrobiales bacterium]
MAAGRRASARDARPSRGGRSFVSVPVTGPARGPPRRPDPRPGVGPADRSPDGPGGVARSPGPGPLSGRRRARPPTHRGKTR